MATDNNNRVSFLIELNDQPGALEQALHVFTTRGVNLTHIESRPEKNGYFDFYVDCEGEAADPVIQAVVAELKQTAEKVLVLDSKTVAWFPRQIDELDRIARNTLDAGSDLTADHPGFNDDAYRARRAMIEKLAHEDRFGCEFPLVEYTAEEHQTWGAVYETLRSLHDDYACRAFRDAIAALEVDCGYSPDAIPQGRDISDFLQTRTGFRLRPVAGLLSARDFLNGLAFRVFFSTQYIRHPSVPAYTPEPDICHEFIGHVPMFADPAFADLSQEIGLASLGASDEEVERLARCYWFSVEFGLVTEGSKRKAYGAGLLSSPAELEYACTSDQPRFHDFEPAEAAAIDNYPITEFQCDYFIADSLQAAKSRIQEFARELSRPFYARYNPTTHRIWVDRAVEPAN